MEGLSCSFYPMGAPHFYLLTFTQLLSSEGDYFYDSKTSFFIFAEYILTTDFRVFICDTHLTVVFRPPGCTREA